MQFLFTHNKRGQADEKSYGGENGGQEGTRQKAYRYGLIEKEQYGDLKRRDGQEWRVWLSGTCHVAEN